MNQVDFALIGAAGYIAPRHMKAVKDTGNRLTAAVDKNDSVGILDSYFPEVQFYVEFEQFTKNLNELKGQGKGVDYVAIASPNYLHNAHIQTALRHDAHAICEKPLVLDPEELEELIKVEAETQKKVYTILQLRLHPSIIALKKKVADEININKDKIYNVDLTYLTSRGSWYFTSWKGAEDKSGGIATNIGVHFFDMLGFIFGDLEHSEVHCKNDDVNAGYLQFKHARVRWFLSVKYDYIPQNIKGKGLRTYRSITVDGEEIEFSGGFTDLHTVSYEHILSGKGFGLDDARKSIEIVSSIRNMDIDTDNESAHHPFLKQLLSL